MSVHCPQNRNSTPIGIPVHRRNSEPLFYPCPSALPSFRFVDVLQKARRYRRRRRRRRCFSFFAAATSVIVISKIGRFGFEGRHFPGRILRLSRRVTYSHLVIV